MISKFARIAVVMLGFSLVAFAQADQSAAAPPNAPSTAAAAAPKTGTKIGTLNIEMAVLASNEGQRDLEGLRKKVEPKQNELKSLADEIDSLQKQLNAQTDKLNDESRDKLLKQIEAKRKSYERANQDFQEDVQAQQGEIGNRILTKMSPLIEKYITDNGYGLILDTSNPWQRGGSVIVSGPAFDITQAIVDAYNVQSGVPAPAAGTAPVKPAAKPATGTKPAAKPATTTPPKQ